MKIKRKVNKITALRLHGFTIYETMITMVLSGLLMLLVLATAQYYMRLFNNVIKVEELQSEICMFHQVISEDVRLANKVYFDDHLICINDIANVEYSFDDGKIVRSNSFSVDTFFIEHSLTTIQRSLVNEDWVENIVVECFNKELVFPVSVIKRYPFLHRIEK